SIVVGRRPSLFEQYRTAIIAGAIFILAQSFVIILLLFQRARRKRAEAALRNGEEQFRTLAEALPGMLSIADQAGPRLYVNQSHQQYTGLGDASVGEFGLRLVHPDDIDRTQATCQRCMREGRVFEIEHRIRRHDGSWRWHLTRSIPLRSKNGEIER